MKKLVFFDIDGTLVTKNNHIPSSTIHAIEKLKENNIEPVLATGRPPVLLEDIAEKLNINSYIAMNGQYIVFKGEPIYKNALSKSLVDEIIQLATEHRHGIVLCAEDELVINSFFSLFSRGILFTFVKEIVGKMPEHIQFSLFNQVLKRKPKEKHYKNKDIFMINVRANQSEEKFYRSLSDDLSFTRANKTSFDVIDQGISKATGIEKMLKKLNIPIEDTYAFGDGMNDLEMLNYVGVGIAMENGFTELKQEADFVTASVYDDGIEKALKEFQLI